MPFLCQIDAKHRVLGSSLVIRVYTWRPKQQVAGYKFYLYIYFTKFTSEEIFRLVLRNIGEILKTLIVLASDTVYCKLPCMKSKPIIIKQ